MVRLIIALAVLAVLGGAAALTGCGSGSPEGGTTPTPAPSTAVSTPKAARTSGVNAQGVRYCDNVPGESEPATMPREVLNPPSPTPSPTPRPPAQTLQPPETTRRQLDVLQGIRSRVADAYVYPDFNGRDWDAITARYEVLVAAGQSDDDFYVAMNTMISELGDEHSYYQSPAEVAEEAARRAEGEHFVGIGVLAVPIAGALQTGAIISVFPDGPADEAGLRAHDLLLEVDGDPYREEDGTVRSLGPEGTTFELTYQRPGGLPQTITLTRRPVSGFLPVDYCIVPDTRIGYVLLPTFLDESIDDQVRVALQKMTADGPLDGLVLDNRLNGGGSSLVLEPMLGFFTSGNQGASVGREGERPPDITAEDVGGSQGVPLVILADRDTMSYAEVFTGVLQISGRATVVGGRTAGNVETLTGVTLDADGSRLWLATEAFAPAGLAPGAWERNGVAPDVSMPTRWDLFTEATDPALTRAVELLQQ